MQRKPLPTQQEWDDINNQLEKTLDNIENNPNLSQADKQKFRKEILDQVQVANSYFQSALKSEQETIKEEQHGKKFSGFSYSTSYDYAVTQFIKEWQGLRQKIAMHTAPQYTPQPVQTYTPQPVQTSFQVPKNQAVNIIRDFKPHLPPGINTDANGRINGLNLSTPKSTGQTSTITFSGPNAQVLAQAFSTFYNNYLQGHQPPSKKF